MDPVAGRIEWTTGWRDLFAAPIASPFFHQSPSPDDNYPKKAQPKKKSFHDDDDDNTFNNAPSFRRR
jgi:hypothetical protein